jgi:hypothetical protein
MRGWGQFKEEDAVEARQAPTLPILRNVGVRHAAQFGIVAHHHGLSLDTMSSPLVRALWPEVMTNLSVVRQVLSFALAVTGAEVEGAVQQTAISGATCGRPSGRTVEIQNTDVARLAADTFGVAVEPVRIEGGKTWKPR